MNFRRITDVCLLILFCLFICLPMTRLSKAEKSEKENRMLAKYEPMFVDGEFNPYYFYHFSRYFRDRFYLRNELMQIYLNIIDKYSLYGGTTCFKGKDGWLFYNNVNFLDVFQNKTMFTDKELEHIAEYLSYIHNWANQNSKSFYFVIVPNKNKVYGEYMSKFRKIRDDSESRANQLVRYLKKNTDVDVLYLYDALRENKDNGFLLYYKDDLHWTDYGAYIGYKYIINNISKKYTSLKQVKYVISTDSNNCLLVDSDADTICISPEIFLLNKNRYAKLIEECFYENPKKTLKVTVFRDSFTSALMQYFNRTFNYSKYYWKYCITVNDLIEMSDNNTDIVILELVESSLPGLVLTSFPDGV